MAERTLTERSELAVRHTVGSIMSGRADVDQVIMRLSKQGFQPAEIEAILTEASRRMSAAGKAADNDFFNAAIRAGSLLLLLAFGLTMVAGFPEHGRGKGVFYSAIIIGLGALGYGAFGKLFRR